jgi:hypothetical protein
LRVFENRVLRRMFGLKTEEVAGSCRWLHSENLHNLYPSPNNIRVIKSRRVQWVIHVACMGFMRSVYKMLVGECTGKRPLRRCGCRWEVILEWILGK